MILACHEPTRKVLIPLLLGALNKYKLMDQFKEVVKGKEEQAHLPTFKVKIQNAYLSFSSF